MPPILSPARRKSYGALDKVPGRVTVVRLAIQVDFTSITNAYSLENRKPERTGKRVVP